MSKIDYSAFPDPRGRFGDYGGRFVAETLMEALDELTQAYEHYRKDPTFIAELEADLQHYVGRQSPLYHARRWSEELGGAQIYLKREDLNHTGAHKINHAIGQGLLAKRMGKTRIIAETGAGQHGVATATVAARMGLECVVYMGAEDIQRQAPNVFRMRLLGAEVVPVTSGSQTLKDALNEAMRDWVANIDNTFYIIGTVAGPHPYPQMVRDFQAVIGHEAREQVQAQAGKLPDALVACVGGGSNAMGLFYAFLNDDDVAIYGETHSISAGLDYPGVGPEHAWLKDIGRVQYVSITDTEAMDGFHTMTRVEGIIPALESSHAIAYVKKLAPSLSKDQVIVMSLSGRGDKDINTIAAREGISL